MPQAGVQNMDHDVISRGHRIWTMLLPGECTKNRPCYYW